MADHLCLNDGWMMHTKGVEAGAMHNPVPFPWVTALLPAPPLGLQSGMMGDSGAPIGDLEVWFACFDVLYTDKHGSLLQKPLA